MGNAKLLRLTSPGVLRVGRSAGRSAFDRPCIVLRQRSTPAHFRLPGRRRSPAKRRPIWRILRRVAKYAVSSCRTWMGIGMGYHDVTAAEHCSRPPRPSVLPGPRFPRRLRAYWAQRQIFRQRLKTPLVTRTSFEKERYTAARALVRTRYWRGFALHPPVTFSRPHMGA